VTYIYLATYICPTKFSDVGFCPTKFKLCPTKIKSDRTNVLSSQIFICSPAQRKPLVPLVEPNWKLCSHMRVRNHCNQTTVYYRNRTPEHRCQYMVTRSAFAFRFHAHHIPCGQPRTQALCVVLWLAWPCVVSPRVGVARRCSTTKRLGTRLPCGPNGTG
jgi:hypothetical protein